MTSMKEMRIVVSAYEKLSREWSKPHHSLEICGDLLSKLKVQLTHLKYLPVYEKATKQELVLARDILEIGALCAVEKKDMESFERYMSQLKCYYLDYKGNLPESPYKYQLLGLNLLVLLAQNRLADFHTEIELLPVKDLQKNVYLKHPIALEQYLMEGSYNKVFLSRGNVPADNYRYIIDLLLGTIRDEIASCMEKAYTKVEFSEAARMLFFDSIQPMKEYASKRQWKMNGNDFMFVSEMNDSQVLLPSDELAKRMIGYAGELEKIV